MKKVFTLFILSAMVLMACEQKQPPAGEATEPIDMHRNLYTGDSTLYGLVCDGCTDSILILLPFSGGDPDTFDIINAFHDRKIYGRPQTGDELAVILNPHGQRGSVDGNKHGTAAWEMVSSGDASFPEPRPNATADATPYPFTYS